MEAISYVNIFETKGLEYLLVIFFLVGFLFFVRMVSSSGDSIATLSTGLSPAVNVEDMKPRFLCLADHECPFKKLRERDDREEAVAEEENVA